MEFTFVFFILHLSHAFHTLLCLASAIECVDWLSDGIGEWMCECDIVVLERLVTRCAGLVDFAPGLCLFAAVGCGLCCPSSGGLGRLCSIFFCFCVRYHGGDYCQRWSEICELDLMSLSG